MPIWLIIVMAGWSSVLWANELRDISFVTLPGNRVQVVMILAEPIAVPSFFSTDNPARIAIDLPGTRSLLKRKVMPIGVGAVRSVAVVEAADRTRMVINLIEPVPHQVRSQDKRLLVDIGGFGGVATMKAADRGTADTIDQATVAEIAQVLNIDFRRGPEGEGKVQIKLSTPSIVVDTRQEGQKIVLDLLGIRLPAELARVFDVTDFATPVTEMVARPQGRNTRLVIATQGEFDYLAYQAEDTYTIEFRALNRAEVEERRMRHKVYVGDRLSLNFQDIKVRSVLQLLADFTGLNMVVSDSVGGHITLRLKNVPWDQALDLILEIKGLSMRRNDNVILVAPIEEIAAREKLELESQKQIEELAPLRSEFIQVNYAKAVDLAALLKSKENKLLSDRGNVTIDERTNSLLVQDTAAKLSELRKLIGSLDVPVRQVLIESRIVIANNDFAKDLGVKLGLSGRNQLSTTDNILVVGGGLAGDGAATAIMGKPIISTGGNNENLLVNLPQTLAAGSGGAINFILGKIGSHLLRLELNAMQQEGKGEIISSPRVITSDQNKAVIKQGVEIPYQQATSSGATTVAFKEAVLQLEVTPHITPDDRVIMDIKVNKDNPDFTRSVLGVPPVDTRSLETSVLVDNGETVVLGGVFERTKSRNVGRVPFFGDLPYVGWAFKQEQVKDQNNELLIFVTPRILKDTLSLR